MKILIKNSEILNFLGTFAHSLRAQFYPILCKGTIQVALSCISNAYAAIVIDDQ